MHRPRVKLPRAREPTVEVEVVEVAPRQRGAQRRALDLPPGALDALADGVRPVTAVGPREVVAPAEQRGRVGVDEQDTLDRDVLEARVAARQRRLEVELADSPESILRHTRRNEGDGAAIILRRNLLLVGADGVLELASGGQVLHQRAEGGVAETGPAAADVGPREEGASARIRRREDELLEAAEVGQGGAVLVTAIQRALRDQGCDLLDAAGRELLDAAQEGLLAGPRVAAQSVGSQVRGTERARHRVDREVLPRPVPERG